MYPRFAGGEGGDEEGCRDGAGRAASRVFQVGYIAFDLFFIFLEQRQFPHPLPRRHRRVEHQAAQLAVVAHDAGGDVAESHYAGTSEGGEVDHVGGAEAEGVRDGVGQDETAFGVGADNLHRLAAEAADNVAGPESVSGRQILGAGHDGDDIYRRFERGDRLHGAEHRRGAGHVVLHFMHVFAGF